MPLRDTSLYDVAINSNKQTVKIIEESLSDFSKAYSVFIVDEEGENEIEFPMSDLPYANQLFMTLASL